MRGAERTFDALASCWPDAPIYTLLFDPEGTEGCFEGREVTTSYLQRSGARQARFRSLLPLFPGAVESLPVQQHDLVITSSSAFAHGVRPNADAVHIAYCHSPLPLRLARAFSDARGELPVGDRRAELPSPTPTAFSRP